jgi:predicted nucleic acid-binding Zn ribbon protein
MPKYKPDEEDLYEVKPCPVCGTDIIDEKRETCSFVCQMSLESYLEFCETAMFDESHKK